MILGILRNQSICDRERAPKRSSREHFPLPLEQIIADRDMAKRDACQHTCERVSKDGFLVFWIVERAPITWVHIAVCQRCLRYVTSSCAKRYDHGASLLFELERFIERGLDNRAFGHCGRTEQHDDDVGCANRARFLGFFGERRGLSYEASFDERREAETKLAVKRFFRGHRGDKKLDGVLHGVQHPSYTALGDRVRSIGGRG